MAIGLGVAAGVAADQATPIPAGLARLTVERAEEVLFYRQDALIAVNGGPVGRLGRGAKLALDLAPGTWRVSASTRPGAEPATVSVVLKEHRETRVRVELDPVRFPPERNSFGLLSLLGLSLEAPFDDRQPLFLPRLVQPETPEGESGR